MSALESDKAYNEEALEIPREDEKRPLSIRPTLELFQRVHLRNFYETGWCGCALSQVYIILNKS